MAERVDKYGIVLPWEIALAASFRDKIERRDLDGVKLLLREALNAESSPGKYLVEDESDRTKLRADIVVLSQIHSGVGNYDQLVVSIQIPVVKSAVIGIRGEPRSSVPEIAPPADRGGIRDVPAVPKHASAGVGGSQAGVEETAIIDGDRADRLRAEIQKRFGHLQGRDTNQVIAEETLPPSASKNLFRMGLDWLKNLGK